MSDHLNEFAPAGVADAIMTWARTYGRTAQLKRSKMMKCWVIELSVKEDDPKMVAYNEGRLKTLPVELMPLHRHNPETGHFEEIPLEEYGASGIVAMLEEANTWSGRGEYGSIFEAAQAAIEANRQQKEHYMTQVEEAAKESAWLHGRRITGNPLVNVGVDLKTQGAVTDAAK